MDKRSKFTKEEKERFLNKEMIKGYYLYDYIIPIVNNLDLDTI